VVNPQLTVPKLRQDVRLLRGATDPDGAPRWMLYDALRNQYFYIAKDTLSLLRHWKAGTRLDAFHQQCVKREQYYTLEELQGFIEFLMQNQLVVVDNESAVAQLMEQKNRKQQAWWMWLIHNYLFIRIPLFRPDAWLSHWVPRLAWLFDARWHYGIVVLGTVGILMVLRQWEQFLATFLHFFSWEGLGFYALTLIVVKTLHELGHAFVAKRYGCRISSMGVALLVMFPLLYTDTTDVWKLRSRIERLQIVLAGLRVEMYLALIATFVWPFLPDGWFRSAAFFIATTSWVTSLSINLTPFLRFDGYYAMSDALGIENLQARGFAFGRWYLRKQLFGLQDPPPESFKPSLARLLIGYAWGTWLYRFLLFIGIAMLVYYFAFKVLGIVLFLVEIWWFIALPIWREMKQWWKEKEQITLNRYSLRSMLALALVLGLAFYPFSANVWSPAVLKAQFVQRIYPQQDARLIEVRIQEGQTVQADQVLFVLRSEMLEHEKEQLDIQLTQLSDKLKHLAGASDWRVKRRILEQQQTQLQRQKAAVEQRLAKLVIRAPFDAQVSQVTRISVGQSVGATEVLAHLWDSRSAEIVGFVSEQDVRRVAVDQTACFVADDGSLPSLTLRIAQVDDLTLGVLPYPELVSDHGGPIAARQDPQGQYWPQQTYYRVVFAIESDTNDALRRQPGLVQIQAEPMSFAQSAWKRVMGVLVRESGF